ncbi:hypothetical protein ACFLU5_01730 [Bacteroidota bacterium]
MEIFLGIIVTIVYIGFCIYVASMSTKNNPTGFWGIFFISYLLTPPVGWLFIIRSRKRTLPLTVPITIVDHKEDGSWDFFSNNYLTRIKIADLEEAVENDSSINEIGDLPIGFSAERKTSKSKWIRYKKSER